jgi:hypothetical protein
MLKSCSRCSNEAEISVVVVVSTVGSRPRRQKCSTAVPFCHGCMRDLLAGGHLLTDDLRKSVNNAYTHVGGAWGDADDQKTCQKRIPTG